MNRAVLALLFACAPPAAAQDSPSSRKVVFVVSSFDAWTRPVVRALTDAVASPDTARVLEISPGALTDPIRRGRLEYAIGLADLVVPIGDAAADFVFHINEGALVYFVGAADLSGRALDSPRVGGLLGFDVEEVATLAASEWPTRLGLAYPLGFESVAAAAREAAEKKGVAVTERRVTGEPTADDAAIAELLRDSPAVWIFGRTLNDGASFTSLLARAREAGVAVIAASPAQVEKGALLCEVPQPGPLAEAAAAKLKAILGGRLALPEPRLSSGPAGGVFNVNRQAADRLRLDFSGRSLRWVP